MSSIAGVTAILASCISLVAVITFAHAHLDLAPIFVLPLLFVIYQKDIQVVISSLRCFAHASATHKLHVIAIVILLHASMSPFPFELSTAITYDLFNFTLFSLCAIFFLFYLKLATFWTARHVALYSSTFLHFCLVASCTYGDHTHIHDCRSCS